MMHGHTNIIFKIRVYSKEIRKEFVDRYNLIQNIVTNGFVT